MTIISSFHNSSPRSSGTNIFRLIIRYNPWALFLLGCCMGHWHGRFLATTGTYGGTGSGSTISSSNNIDEEKVGVITVSTRRKTIVIDEPQQVTSTNQIDCRCIEDGNGWHSIQVFYGHTDHLDTTTASWPILQSQPEQEGSSGLNATVTTNSIPDQEQVRKQDPVELQQYPHRWYGQARQDEMVYALLRNKTNGFFIDLACNDATDLSNTFALETYYGWRGVCIEPNPIYWSNLTYRPGCTVIGAVVGAERMQEVHFRFEAEEHGGIADHGFDNGKRWQQSSQKRYTVTLLEILRERIPQGTPIDIDYLSLDVEGEKDNIEQEQTWKKFQPPKTFCCYDIKHVTIPTHVVFLFVCFCFTIWKKIFRC